MSSKQEALWRQGQQYSSQGRWSQAAAAYASIVDHAPTFLPAWMELSLAKEKLDAYRDSRAALLAAARIPDTPPVAAMGVARRLRKFQAGSELLAYVARTRLHEHVPPGKLVDLASFFSSIGIHEPVIAWTQRALELDPTLYGAHNLQGLTHMFAGRANLATEAFERALSILPTFAPTYSVLSTVAAIDARNNHVDVLRTLLERPGLSDSDESHLGFALHNELHALGDHAPAWEAWERGARARRRIAPYDHARTKAMFAQIKQTCDAAFCVGEAFDHAWDPIFIVGMHRSGTTLLERILAGHPDVTDAGETYTFAAGMRHAANHFCGTVLDERIAERLGSLDYREVAGEFVREMEWRVSGRPFITEKLNPNFMLLGPIARALPHARLLHMRRDPIDTCFSNLRTLFTNEATYSYDQHDIADFYSEYRDLMRHWQAVMPGRVLDIEYEALVQSPGQEAAAIAGFCGFSFDPAMLDVQRSSGMVATASSNQVRRGILANRGGAWRSYERWLGPLVDRLAGYDLI